MLENSVVRPYNTKRLRCHILIQYSLSGLEQKDKVKVLRELFGYKDFKNGNSYSYEGILQKYKGVKLGRNLVLVPIEESVRFQNFFSSKNIKVAAKEVWIQ
ncbi:hypothetical protein J4209_06370 [Candidatus Woesearchaeota archaeon]|nr:hypothetical protein [Candidatus Woesearchaeota archaeon]